MWAIILSLCMLEAGQGIPDRLSVLRTQLDGLRAIQVPGELKDRAAGQLNELAGAIAKGAATGQEIDAIYLRMDELRTWLLSNAVDRPVPGRGEFFETNTEWGVRNTSLTLAIDRKNLSMSAKTPGATWRWRPADNKDIELRNGKSFSLMEARRKEAGAFHTGFSTGMRITFAGFPAAPKARIDLVVHLIGAEAVFEIVPVEDIANLATLAFPKELETGNTETDVAVIPRMQGILIPGNWLQEIHYRDLANSRALYMPWWGQLAGEKGVQTILETSDDAGAEYAHVPGEPTRVQPLWYSSMGRLRYPRVVRYVFDDNGGYVRMAKRYRRYVQEAGRFVSLAEKRIRTPNLDRVIGKPVVHIGALYHNAKGSRFYRTTRMESNHQLQTFENLAALLRTLKAAGIAEAYVHLDGWGFYGYDNAHPDVLPPGPEQGGWDGMRLLADTCDSLGYLLAVHDQYRDFYFSAASYDDKLALINHDGTLTEHAEWSGGRQTLLSPRFAPGYVRRNHDLFAEHGIRIKGAYLDVFAVVPLEESYQPSHPVTRSDCARYRRECFDLLRARGYVVSSEEPADYLVCSLDLVHHGPYPTLPKGYGPGQGQGIAVPLFNLVYHDSVLLPWDLTEDGGWGIPSGDSGRLHCLLNAGLPYVSPNASPQTIAQVQEVLSVVGRLNTQEMTDHRFLDPARRVQETTFADGTRITVDFARKTCAVTPPGATRPG
ncbi:MAG: DUF5696 domain-containing protein [Phycisphaerae bacterium]